MSYVGEALVSARHARPTRQVAGALVLAAMVAACSSPPTAAGPAGTADTAGTAPAEPASPSTSRTASPDPTPPASRERTTVRGIDLSHHQADPDWSRVAGSGIDFAYLKATEGSTYTDPEVVERWAAASAAGLRVGAYHYYTLCSPPLPQAEHFLDVLDTLAAARRTLPPVVDVELVGACVDPPSRAELVGSVRAWTARVQEATGEEVVVYSHPDLVARYDLGDGSSTTRPASVGCAGSAIVHRRARGGSGSGPTTPRCPAWTDRWTSTSCASPAAREVVRAGEGVRVAERHPAPEGVADLTRPEHA